MVMGRAVPGRFIHVATMKPNAATTSPIGTAASSASPTWPTSSLTLNAFAETTITT